MKTCSKCKEEKPLDQFNRHRSRKDGRQAYCKACRKAYAASEKGKATIAKYNASDKRRATAVGHSTAHRRRYPEKHRARFTVNNAIRYGKLPAPDTQTCATCGEPAEHYHHEAYERPLDVTPLCRPCHIGVHKNGKE